MRILVPAWLVLTTWTACGQTNVLIDWGHTWSYWANTNNYTTNAAVPWCTNDFDDSGWPTKGGIIFAENDPVATEGLPGDAYGGSPSYSLPPLANTNEFGDWIWTYYFRTHFTYDGPLSGIALQLETIYDDGVVYYLNGQELPGTRLNMPTGLAVQWSTAATGSREASDGVLTNVVVNPARLVPGDNVLAAEVHQATSGSADMVFGLRLLARPTSPPLIGVQPVPLITAKFGTATNMSVVLGGGDPPLSYLWYRGPVGEIPTNHINGATAATYAFTADPTNALNYWCVVANPFGRATSSVCTVNVLLDPLVFTLQPTNQTLVERGSLLMAGAVTGSQPAYRWQKYTNQYAFNTNHALTATGWTNISTTFNSTATSSNYLRLEGPSGGLRTNDAGFYRLTATNWYYGATSAVAALTVLKDTFGPALVSAEAQEYPGMPFLTNIVLTFSEFVYGNVARATSNYSVADLRTGQTYPLVRVSGPGTYVKAVSLEVDSAAGLPIGTNHLYVVTVNNLRDYFTNVIAPDSQVIVRQRFSSVPVPADAVWRWNEDDVPLAAGWTTNYLEGVDINGAAILYGEAAGAFVGGNQYPQVLCPWTALPTLISVGANTHYFAAQFVLPDVAPEGTATLRLVVDDGAVFYLNGAEIGRWNMPAGPIGHFNNATSNLLGSQVSCTNLTVAVTNFLSGANLLAAEVHQYSWAASDVLFSADFSGTFYRASIPPAAPEPELVMERNGGQLTLSWQGGGYVLETTTNLASRWLEVQPDMANPYTTGLTNGVQRFWRLKQKQF